MNEGEHEERKRILIANAIRGSKFSLVSVFTFGIEELVLGGGILLLGTTYLIPINIAAVFTSVAVGFILNEYWTVRHEGFHGGMILGLIWRLFKFEVVYAAGSALGILVQLLIYHHYGLHPVLSNIIGALAAYPLNYVTSMLYVWKIRVWKNH